MTAAVVDQSAVPNRPADPVARRGLRWVSGFWPRVAVVGALSVAAYAFVIQAVAADALSGSRAVMVILLPLLTAMIATGYRRAPRGVSDAESDWIIAILIGVAGLTVITLLSHRFPTFAGLWRFDLVGTVVWVAASTAVMLGIRYVVRMWDMWLFAFGCASPLPILMTGAWFGGSDLALGAQSCVLSAFAVFLASRARPMRWRLTAAMVSLLVGTGAAALIVEGWHHRLALLVAALVGAGVVPLLTFSAVLRLAPARRARVDRARVHASFPKRSTLSIAALVALAAMVLVLNLPDHQPNRPSAAAGWTVRGGLTEAKTFGFITRFMGSDATLIRYTPPTEADGTAVAVDVITSPNPGALNDFRDAMWYRTGRPLNYRPVAVSGAPAVEARETHSDGDAAITDDVANWYALSWVWRTPAGLQQVTVLVAQQPGGRLPEPEPLSLTGTITVPAAWIARQQPDPVDYLDPRVSAVGDRVCRGLMAAAGLIGV